jgi:hypothetical protein
MNRKTEAERRVVEAAMANYRLNHGWFRLSNKTLGERRYNARQRLGDACRDLAAARAVAGKKGKVKRCR